jgi:hypothetical protein
VVRPVMSATGLCCTEIDPAYASCLAEHQTQFKRAEVADAGYPACKYSVAQLRHIVSESQRFMTKLQYDVPDACARRNATGSSESVGPLEKTI